jgi:hypothetical protein
VRPAPPQDATPESSGSLCPSSSQKEFSPGQQEIMVPCSAPLLLVKQVLSSAVGRRGPTS